MKYYKPDGMFLLTTRLLTNHRKYIICSLVDNSIVTFNTVKITPLLEYYLKEKAIWKKYTIV